MMTNREDRWNEQGEQEDSGLFEHYHYTVDPGQSTVRVDKFLALRITNASRNRIQQAADAGCILVNGQPVKSNYKVKPGEEISLVFDFPRRELKIIPEEMPLDIVYEDNQLLVINKPAGLVVHPGHGNYTGTMVNGLAWYLRDIPLFCNNDLRPGLVHRIDKNTSGLLVVAKTELARTKLGLQFYEKTTKRKYLSLVWGRLKEPEGTITGNIGRSQKNRQLFTVYAEEDYGKPAVTHYRLVEDLGYVSLVECRLETGRTHQIRVHMNYLGHPVFNDDTYGGAKILWGTTFPKYRQFVQNCFKILPRQALHAKTLGFMHPVTGEEMLFDSELPADMQEVIERWRTYISGREVEYLR
ncbi:MAG: RluA family pseudouridine synthase [Mangrovibacterium sp.]